MKIYELDIDVDNYETCFIDETVLQKNDFKPINRGKTLHFEKGSINFRYANDEGKAMGDIIYCWGFKGFLVNNNFYNILSNDNKFNIQFIKFQDDFILLNNLRVIDALDNEKTEYKYFEKYIIGVKKYAFKTIDYPALFQIVRSNGLVDMKYFVTDEFIKFVNDNNIKGFLFKEVWDSEVQ